MTFIREPQTTTALTDGRLVADMVHTFRQMLMAPDFDTSTFDHDAHDQQWADCIVPRFKDLDDTGRTEYWARTVELLTPRRQPRCGGLPRR